MNPMTTLSQDLRYAFRMFLKSQVFAIIAGPHSLDRHWREHYAFFHHQRRVAQSITVSALRATGGGVWKHARMILGLEGTTAMEPIEETVWESTIGSQ